MPVRRHVLGDSPIQHVVGVNDIVGLHVRVARGRPSDGLHFAQPVVQVIIEVDGNSADRRGRLLVVVVGDVEGGFVGEIAFPVVAVVPRAVEGDSVVGGIEVCGYASPL